MVYSLDKNDWFPTRQLQFINKSSDRDHLMQNAWSNENRMLLIQYRVMTQFTPKCKSGQQFFNRTKGGVGLIRCLSLGCSYICYASTS